MAGWGLKLDLLGSEAAALRGSLAGALSVAKTAGWKLRATGKLAGRLVWPLLTEDSSTRPDFPSNAARFGTASLLDRDEARSFPDGCMGVGENAARLAGPEAKVFVMASCCS
jgi:hypothetical protein